jgi:hypothetical protein
VNLRILQSWTHWTGPAERFSRSGASNFKNMSPKMRPVKTFSEKDGPQPGFKIEKILHILVPDYLLLPFDFRPVFPPVA